MSYMAGPVLELVALEARIPAQIDAEARGLNVTHVLYTSVEQKKGRGGAGGLLSKMGPAAAMLPGVGALGGAASSVAAGVATQAIMTAATAGMQQQAMDSLMQVQSGSVKAKDEVTLTYQFVTMGGAKPPLEDTLSGKAKQDGRGPSEPARRAARDGCRHGRSSAVRSAARPPAAVVAEGRVLPSLCVVRAPLAYTRRGLRQGDRAARGVVHAAVSQDRDQRHGSRRPRGLSRAQQRGARSSLAVGK